jgi:hypothetical protein
MVGRLSNFMSGWLLTCYAWYASRDQTNTAHGNGLAASRAHSPYFDTMDAFAMLQAAACSPMVAFEIFS